MTTEPRGDDRIVLTGFGGEPLAEQPEVLDSSVHSGVVVRITYPDGRVVEKHWYPQPETEPTVVYRSLTPNQVIDLILAVIGAAGFAACVRSDLDAMVTWRYKMGVARDISKDQAATGLSIIEASSLMTAAQRTAILASWPTA